MPKETKREVTMLVKYTEVENEQTKTFHVSEVSFEMHREKEPVIAFSESGDGIEEESEDESSLGLALSILGSIADHIEEEIGGGDDGEEDKTDQPS